MCRERHGANRRGVSQRCVPSCRMTRLILIGFLFGVPGFLALTGCQSRQTSRGEIRTLDITSVRRRLEFEMRVRDQEQKSKVGAGTKSSREYVYEEGVRIEADGSVYHPNLLDFSLGGLFGLIQQDFRDAFDGRVRNFSEEGDILEFDFEGQILKKKMYPAFVFARRSRRLQPRAFLSSLETTTTSYGVNWQYVSARTPTSLQFSSTDVTLDPLDPKEEVGEQRNRTFRFDTEYRFSDDHVLSFTYDHQDVREKPFELNYNSHELTLTHRLSFGEHRNHQLESEFQYFKQRGTFDIVRWRWREMLRVQHAGNLRSWYRWELIDREQGVQFGVEPIGETSYFLSGALEHKLYESLVTELFLFGHHQEFDSGLRITRYGFQPSFDYRKKNRWGALVIGYTPRIQQEDRSGGARAIEVIDERATFNDPERVILSNANVRVETIMVTSENRLVLYRLGADYRIEVIGNTVELERVPTGRISDGETVLIDYVYELGGDFTLDTVNHNLTIQQNFSFGLSPYYRFRKQSQSLSPPHATGFVPEDLRSSTLGIIYQKRALRAQAEYEDHYSNVLPFRALRLSVSAARDVAKGGTMRLRVRWTDMERSGRAARNTELFTVEGRYRQQISEVLTVEGAVLYRIEHDSFSGTDRGVDVDLALEFASRQTEARVVYEYGRFEDDFARNRNQSFLLQFRRRF